MNWPGAPSFSDSLTRRASPGLSSTSRTRVRWVTISSLRGQLDDLHPELLDRLDDLQKVIDVDRFRHIAVGVQLVGSSDVGFGLRRAQHHHGNAPAGRILVEGR